MRPKSDFQEEMYAGGIINPIMIALESRNAGLISTFNEKTPIKSQCSLHHPDNTDDLSSYLYVSTLHNYSEGASQSYIQTIVTVVQGTIISAQSRSITNYDLKQFIQDIENSIADWSQSPIDKGNDRIEIKMIPNKDNSVAMKIYPHYEKTRNTTPAVVSHRGLALRIPNGSDSPQQEKPLNVNSLDCFIDLMIDQNKTCYITDIDGLGITPETDGYRELINELMFSRNNIRVSKQQ